MKRLSDILPNSIPGNFQSYLKIKKVWNECAGDTISFITTPGSLNEGTLNMSVHDQTWLSEIGFLKGDLINRLNMAGLNVTNINFFFKPRPVTTSERDNKALPRKSMSEKEKKFADRLVATIEDETLRNSFQNAIYAYFTRYTLDDYLNC